VDTWKKNNKSAIKEYNKAYYRKKKHIILYNQKARRETESVLIFDKFDNRPLIKPNKPTMKIITINPKRKFESKTI